MPDALTGDNIEHRKHINGQMDRKTETDIQKDTEEPIDKQRKWIHPSSITT